MTKYRYIGKTPFILYVRDIRYDLRPNQRIELPDDITWTKRLRRLLEEIEE